MATTAIATSYAASLGINPGDVLQTDGTVTVGLLPASPANPGASPTLNAGATTALTGNPDGITTGTNTLSFGTGTTGATGTAIFSQRNATLQNTVLNGGTIGASSSGTGLPYSSTPCAGGNNCQQTVFSPTGKPTFALLGDSAAGDNTNTVGLSNIWYSLSTGTGAASATVTVPVGIFGVNSVSTMINTAGGVTAGGTLGTFSATGANSGLGAYAGDTAYSEVVLTFNTACAGATVATFSCTGTTASETLLLYNGVTVRNIENGVCSCAGDGTIASTTAPSYFVTDPNGGASYQVTTGNEWSGTVSTAGSGGTPASNSTVVLDYQQFPVFSEYQNEWLTSISVIDTGHQSGTTFSRDILSAISVGEVSASATPEPSTLVMLMAGLGIIGIARLRTRKQS